MHWYVGAAYQNAQSRDVISPIISLKEIGQIYAIVKLETIRGLWWISIVTTCLDFILANNAHQALQQLQDIQKAFFPFSEDGTWIFSFI